MKKPSRIPPPARSLHLVDLDNLVGGPGHPERVKESIERYLKVAGFRPTDHLVVAADATLARTAAFEMPKGTRFLVGYGPDGADRRLLEAVPVDHIARRYGRLVVGSGDHAFEQLIRDVRRRRVQVLVVGRRRSIAWRMRRASGAHRGVLVRMLPAFPAAAPSPI